MLNGFDANLEKAFQGYFTDSQKVYSKIPNLYGMSGMDAVAILENLGIEVEVKGNGKVYSQSISKGTDIKKVKKIVLELS